MAIRGTCVFRNDGDGCLSSKYANENSEPFVESCKQISRPPQENDPFVGKFRTVWLENIDDNPVPDILEITRQQNDTYRLVWESTGYKGIGMLYNNLLVCGYWK
jgi:hypothetical protein